MDLQIKMNKLLDNWQEVRKYKQFVRDGVLVSENWEKQHPKILFLLKESHSGFNDISGPMNIHHGASKDFWFNVSRWKFAIYHLYKDKNSKLTLPKNDELDDFIDDIAYINVKKLNEERTTSDDQDLMWYASNDKEFLQKQIELISPDIIICGGTFKFLREIFNADEFENIATLNISKNKNYSRSCFSFKKRIIIDYCHPHQQFYEGGAEALFYELVELLTPLDIKKIIGH